MVGVCMGPKCCCCVRPTAAGEGAACARLERTRGERTAEEQEEEEAKAVDEMDGLVLLPTAPASAGLVSAVTEEEEEEGRGALVVGVVRAVGRRVVRLLRPVRRGMDCPATSTLVGEEAGNT